VIKTSNKPHISERRKAFKAANAAPRYGAKKRFKGTPSRPNKDMLLPSSILGATSMLGTGTPVDFTEPRMRHLIAARQGHEEAKIGLEQYKDALSFTQIETAEKFTREWAEKH
jgi:hypothetical protein